MNSMEYPLFIVNVEGIVRRGKRYLLTLRSETESNAPGTRSLPGGKVEFDDATQDTLEATRLREMIEETSVQASNPVYIESKWFYSDEIADVLWLTDAAVVAHSKVLPWTRQSIHEQARRA